MSWAQKNFDSDYTGFSAANGLDSGRFGIDREALQSHLGFVRNPLRPVDVGGERVMGWRQALAGVHGDMMGLNFSAKYGFH